MKCIMLLPNFFCLSPINTEILAKLEFSYTKAIIKTMNPFKSMKLFDVILIFPSIKNFISVFFIVKNPPQIQDEQPLTECNNYNNIDQMSLDNTKNLNLRFKMIIFVFKFDIKT